MKVVVRDDPDQQFHRSGNTVGLTGVKSPHNEKPIGCYNIDLMRDWLDLIDSFDRVENVYIWAAGGEVEPEDGEYHHLVATPGLQPSAGIVLAGRVHHP